MHQERPAPRTGACGASQKAERWADGDRARGGGSVAGGGGGGQRGVGGRCAASAVHGPDAKPASRQNGYPRGRRSIVQRALGSMLVGTALACTTPERARGPAFVLIEALEVAPQDGHKALRLCNQLEDSDTRDHCIASVIDLSGDPSAAAYACPSVGAEVWKQECYFMAAEAAIRLNQDDDAQTWCRSSGSFAHRCLIHLWRRDADSLFRSIDPADAARAIAEEYDRLTALLGEDAMARQLSPNAPPGLWPTTLLAYFRRTPTISIQVCEDLNKREREITIEWCSESLGGVLEERLGKLQVANPELVRRGLCRHAGLTDQQVGLDPLRTPSGPLWTDSPTVRRVLARWADEHCD